MDRRRQGNTSPQKTNNLIADSVENEHQVADSSRMIRIYLMSPMRSLKTCSKKNQKQARRNTHEGV
jgi:hypothetical protein